MPEPHRRVSLGFADEAFPSGLHACYIFSELPERASLVARFLAAGLRAGEQVSAFTDTFDEKAIAGALDRLGLPAGSPELRGALSLMPSLDAYCPDGRFDVARMLGRVRDLGHFDSRRYSGMRVTGEMTWALMGLPGSEGLMEYEARLNDIVAEEPAVNAVCQYDANRFDARTLANALQVHPLMIVRGQLIRNPRYTPPGEYFHHRSASRPRRRGA